MPRFTTKYEQGRAPISARLNRRRDVEFEAMVSLYPSWPAWTAATTVLSRAATKNVEARDKPGAPHDFILWMRGVSRLQLPSIRYPPAGTSTCRGARLEGLSFLGTTAQLPTQSNSRLERMRDRCPNAVEPWPIALLVKSPACRRPQERLLSVRAPWSCPRLPRVITKAS